MPEIDFDSPIIALSPWPESGILRLASEHPTEYGPLSYEKTEGKHLPYGAIRHLKQTNGAIFRHLSQWIHTAQKVRWSRLFHPTRKDEAYHRSLLNDCIKEAAEIGGRKQIQHLVKEWLLKHKQLKSLNQNVNPVFPLGYEKYFQPDEFFRKIFNCLLPPFPKLEGLDAKTAQAARDSYRANVKKVVEKNSSLLFALKEVIENPESKDDEHPDWAQSYLRTDDLYELKNRIEWQWIPTSLEEEERREWVLHALGNLFDFGVSPMLGHGDERKKNPEWKNNAPPRWISKEDLLDLFVDLGADENENGLPEVCQRWLTSYPYYFRLSETNLFQLCHRLSEVMKERDDASLPQDLATRLRRALVSLEISYAENVGLDRKHAAIFKAGGEAFLEQQPLFVAKLLGLGHIVVDGEVATLDQTLGESSREKSVISNPVGNIQRFISGGITPNDLRHWMKTKPHQALSIYENISLQNYQETALFAAITKQGDLHTANAFLLKDSDGKWNYKLFDIGRCLLPDGYLKRSKGTQLTLRSFLIPMKQFRQPLTQKTMDLIMSWDIGSFEKHFTINEKRDKIVYKLAREIQNIEEELSLWSIKPHYQDHQLRAVRDREKLLNELLSSHIVSSKLRPMVRRLKALQNLCQKHQVENLPAPTMRDLYKALFPIEMDFLRLYTKALGDEEEGALHMAYTPIEEVLKIGIKQGRITAQEEQYWLAKRERILRDPHLQPIRDWTRV